MNRHVTRNRQWPAAVIAALALAAAAYLLLPRPPAAVAAGDPVRTGPFTVTVKGLVFQAPLALSDPGNHWIAVLARVELTAAQSWPGLPAVLALHDISGLVSQDPKIFLLRDGSNGGPLQPGVAEVLAFCWEQRADSPAPPQAKVDIGRWVPLLKNAAGQQQWARTGTAAVVTTGAYKPEPAK